MTDTKPRLKWTDEDGDTFEVVQVYGMGYPAASIFIENGDTLNGITLTVQSAAELRNWLTEFIERSKAHRPEA